MIITGLEKYRVEEGHDVGGPKGRALRGSGLHMPTPQNSRAVHTYEMGVGIAANPHYPVLFRALPPHLIPARFSCDQRSAKRSTAARSGTIRRRFGRPPFGGRPHLESPSSSLLASVETFAAQAMDCISCTRSGSPQLVGIAAFRDQAIDRFLRQSDRSLLAGLATTLDVPEVRRLCRPMIES